MEGINYLGDWGKQFGLVAVGFQEYGDPARRGEMAHLVEVYVKANARAEQDPAFDAEARAFFRKMEQGDPEARALWTEFRETSLRGFLPIYERLGIRFEHIDGESLYEDRMDAVIEEICQHRRGRRRARARSSSTCPTPRASRRCSVKKGRREHALRHARPRRRRGPLGALPLRPRALRRRPRPVAPLPPGVPGAEGDGQAVGGPLHPRLLRPGHGDDHPHRASWCSSTDVLDEAHDPGAGEGPRRTSAAGRIHTDDPEQLAEQMGLGAIVFGDLKNRRNTDYTFDWDEVLEFDGHTGPYLQYAHARACNILQARRRRPGHGVRCGAARACPRSRRSSGRWPASRSRCSAAVEQNEPSFVARHLIDVGRGLQPLVHARQPGPRQAGARRIGNEALRAARLALTDAVRIVLASGLQLLGIAAPESM